MNKLVGPYVARRAPSGLGVVLSLALAGCGGGGGRNDADFGGDTMLYNESGAQCIAALRKDGVFFTFDRSNLSSGPKAQIATAQFSAIESPAHSSVTHMVYLANPSQGQYGPGLIAPQHKQFVPDIGRKHHRSANGRRRSRVPERGFRTPSLQRGHRCTAVEQWGHDTGAGYERVNARQRTRLPHGLDRPSVRLWLVRGRHYFAALSTSARVAALNPTRFA
jgi:hypothetical protein